MARQLTEEQREKKNARDRERRAKRKAQNQKEVNPSKLDSVAAHRRLRSIYRLEKELENKRVALELASSNRRAAKAAYDEAIEALEKEIREQRTGPGPLFNEDGSGARGEPQGGGENAKGSGKKGPLGVV